ncbi:MAG: T9SS type A sorting domain-containing protein [Bacteroidetes bacterium]|nr:T9SS type A sorting domain-containing protein [Bacteroidota bacterium]
MIRVAIICTLLYFCINISTAQWTNNQNASQVIGQPNFITYNNSTLDGAIEIVLDVANGKAYVVDCFHYRVLRFAYPFSGSPITAEMQFGTGAYAYGQNSFTEVLGAAVYNDVLYILDNGHRILRFDNASTKTNQPNANGIIGQTSYTAFSSGTSDTKFDSPQFIYIDGSGNLWVPDQGNNRAVKFSDVNNKPTDGTATADLVLGQAGFITKVSGTSTSSMNGPNGVCARGTTVWVSDTWNYRVLRFDNPSTNGAAANGVLGVTSRMGPTQNKFETPTDLEIDGNGNLYVADVNRVLIFLNAAAKSDTANADNILGQSSWTSDAAGGDANGLNVNWSEGLAIDNANNKLFVADLNNNRVLGFTAGTALPVELTSFAAALKNNVVELQWSTATEENNYGFEIERKPLPTPPLKGEGTKGWGQVGFVEGSGTTNAPKQYSFSDKNIFAGKYSYRLKQIDHDGKFEYSKTVEATAAEVNSFGLEQNYPNPFNPTTVIAYQLPITNRITLKVYDVIGREVATLVNEIKEAGYYSATFNASKLSSGVYFARLQSGNVVQMKKLLLVK